MLNLQIWENIVEFRILIWCVRRIFQKTNIKYIILAVLYIVLVWLLNLILIIEQFINSYKQKISNMLVNRPVFSKINEIISRGESFDQQQLVSAPQLDPYANLQVIQIDHNEYSVLQSQQIKYKSNRVINQVIVQKSALSIKEQMVEDNNKKNILQGNKISQIEEEKPKIVVQQVKTNIKYINCSDFMFCSQIPSRKINHFDKCISLSDFETKINNMDIILFKNSNPLSRMQRLLTNSNYDHVAIIIKINNHRYILESSGKAGVCLYDFKKFVVNLQNKQNSRQPHKYQVAYRRFQRQKCSLTQLLQIERKSEEFARRVVGKRYKFSPIYLLSRDYQKKQQTYFCSELVAQLLKQCKIAKSGRPSYAFLPRDFSGRQSSNEDTDMQIVSDKQNQGFYDFLENIYQNPRIINLTTKVGSKIRSNAF